MEEDLPIVSIQIHSVSGQVHIHAVRLSHRTIKISEISVAAASNSFDLSLFSFLDDSQLSFFDVLVNQLGSSENRWVISEDMTSFEGQQNSNASAKLSKKVKNIFDQHNIQPIFCKKQFFTKREDSLSFLKDKVSMDSVPLSSIESERSECISCLECIWQTTMWRNSFPDDSKVFISLDSLNSFMRLDTPALDAVNALPKPDHPSTYGSLYGVLNRCKTKIGSRTLDRWLRQPLLDTNEINARLDVVHVFVVNAVLRNRLRDGPLKAVPDLDNVAAKMRKGNAGLPEIFRLYLFARTLPDILAVLQALMEDSSDPELESVKNRFLTPLTSIKGKFSLFESLVEQVVDFNQLPEYKVNCAHDSELKEFADEQDGLLRRAEKILTEARQSWASFADVKLEKNTQHGFILRTTKGDDERTLRENNPQVKILSILKNGVHFTVPALERISDRYKCIDLEYLDKQQVIVSKAMDTAATYLPLLEATMVIIAELDVLQGFATAACSSTGQYTRPNILPLGSGIIQLSEARHPCLELMEDVSFISNDYLLKRGESGFQIITGPNMGGKSTYIRGIGCISVLAQIGMFVPCEKADITIVDSILARVGAGDAVQKGVSTFMAEMLESSVILRTATRDSLIIIDELGRGTSTYDGFGIAWAMSQHLAANTQCFCLFATHFHELTVLAEQQIGVINRHVTAHVEGDRLVMLYRLQEGPCTKSFGIPVAASADFPMEVLDEARRKASLLERSAHIHSSEEELQSARNKMRKIEGTVNKFMELDVPKLTAEALKARIQDILLLNE